MKRTAFITGATSGIGKATAELFAQNEIKLVLCGRREERLSELKKSLSQFTEVVTLSFDVSNKEEVDKAFMDLPKDFTSIDILINNAGNAHGLDSFEKASMDDWEAMLDINVKGLLYVTKAILPGMIERNRGDIINIGSTAGKEVYPKGNVYCASKHAVDAINKAMRIDLNPHKGVRIGAVNPGLVETEFSDVRFKGDKERAKQVYQGFSPLTPEDIAEIILFVISRPAHVNIADLVVMPTAQASSTIVNKDI